MKIIVLKICRIMNDQTKNLSINFDRFFYKFAFYIGGLNLSCSYKELEVPICFPTPLRMFSQEKMRVFEGLYDASLVLGRQKSPVGNTLFSENKKMTVITGANNGGKTTFLRSIGQSQLMMQAGLFVCAKKFKSQMCNQLFTHFKRGEDTTLKNGKFDEELYRMNQIIEHISKDDLILFNESFSATNEREGTEIAVQIIDALIENDIEIFFVTHFYSFAQKYYEKDLPSITFLRSERLEDGRRIFHIKYGKPLETAFGNDLYKKVFSN